MAGEPTGSGRAPTDGLAKTKEILEQSGNPDGSAVQVLLIHERSRPGKASRWREEPRRDTTDQDTNTRAGGFLTLICSHHYYFACYPIATPKINTLPHPVAIVFTFFF